MTAAILEHVENPPDSPADLQMASEVIRIKWPEFKEISHANDVLIRRLGRNSERRPEIYLSRKPFRALSPLFLTCIMYSFIDSLRLGKALQFMGWTVG